MPLRFATRCTGRWKRSFARRALRSFRTKRWLRIRWEASPTKAGGCRMGDDPRTSVLDKWCRAHDVKNLFVVDAACFVSHPEKATTHTIMALAYRACDYLTELLRTA